MISQVAEGMGLQNWWSEPMTIEDENPKKLLIRELSKRILEADWSNATRADNLNRGLAGQEHAFVRRVINAFIKCQFLTPNSTLTGLSIQKGAHPNWDRVLSTMVDGSSFPEEITILFS